MSRSTVRSTVAAAIDSVIEEKGVYVTPQYQSVIDAVTERVSADVDTLIDTAQETLTTGAVGLGASRAQVERLFTQAGVNHDPEPVVEEEDDEEFTVTKSAWETLTAKVEGALSFARSRGYRD